MPTTIVKATKIFQKQLERLPEHIRIKVLLWIQLVETCGLGPVRARPGYHDEPLKGERQGQRSVRMNRAYRLIYREVTKEVEILIMEVNKHEY